MLAARQRYRYDSANQRTVKQTLDVNHIVGSESAGLDTCVSEGTPCSYERIALYVYGGDVERRGLYRVDDMGDLVYAHNDESETQYLVGGARMVRKVREEDPGVLDPDDRITVGITDLIQTTSAVIDLVSGALVETSTYYPNGARETYRAPDTQNVAAEPYGFTGKEADEEVGLVYFGERYLIPRIGRWASPDPLSIHAAGGGEALNAYHYVSGNLLQARDPLGLQQVAEGGGGYVTGPVGGGPVTGQRGTMLK
jgi:RHS repeat-associated protein